MKNKFESEIQYIMNSSDWNIELVKEEVKFNTHLGEMSYFIYSQVSTSGNIFTSKELQDNKELWKR